MDTHTGMATAELLSANSVVPSRYTTTQKIFARNPSTLENAISFTGKTDHGYIRTCMCGVRGCTRELAWRYAAIRDPAGIVGKYITVPAMPINPRTEGQKKTALFVAMIYDTLELPITSAVKDLRLSILHWHPRQRTAMLRSKSSSLARGLLEPDTDAPLIRWLLSEGHLSVDEELQGGFYYNKPNHTMQSIEDELVEKEITFWTQSGRLLEQVILANDTVRVGKQPLNCNLTFRALLDEKINARAIDPAGNSCTEPGFIINIIPFFVRSRKKQRFESIARRGMKVSIDLNNVGSTLVPMYASGTASDHSVRPARGSGPSPLLNYRSLELGSSRERYFVERKGYEFYLDSVGNPCYWDKSKRQGYWLVSDFLSDDVVENVITFARSHRLDDLGIYLSILCTFVSELPNAKKKWDCHTHERAGCQGGRFDKELRLSECFQSDLINTAAHHIGKLLDLKDGKRFLWETWDPFNDVFDCIYERNMKLHRRRQRSMALEGIPQNQHGEHLRSLSRLHKFMIILWTQQSSDEMSEEMYNRVCYGFHSIASFLKPLKDLSYTDVMVTLKSVFTNSSLNGIKADSLLQFCLVSHLMFDGDCPCGYEGLALSQVSWKKLSIALIVSGKCVAVPVDIHLKRFFGVFAACGEDESDCIEALRVRTQPSIARYTNDFVAEIGQTLDRGSDTSINFALHVLKDVAAKDQRYPQIIKKWLECYKDQRGHKAILKKGEELEFDQFLN